MNPLHDIAIAQVERGERLRSRTATELQLLLHRALSPMDVRKALLKERPVFDALRDLQVEGPNPAQLRAEARAVGLLECGEQDLAYRQLFPSLDLGVYCANHSVGKPSAAAQMALEQFYAQHAVFGVDAFVEAGWLDVYEDTRQLIGELCGDPGLQRGDVAYFGNLSEALSAVLNGLSGRLVTTQGHFTTGHYIHHHWAELPGNSVVEVAQDRQECIPTEQVIDALTANTAVVSLSHVHWRTSYVQDIDAICQAMASRCPDAVLLLDVYQGHGTVPTQFKALPARSALMGGGLKQLHGGLGAGYAWVSHALLSDLRPDRMGWWAHADPMAFEPGPVKLGEGAARLRTGTPSLLPIVMLGTELKVLAASGADGTLTAGVDRARARTMTQVQAAVQDALSKGMTVRGPTKAERRGAFFAVEVKDGPAVLEGLGDSGVTADFRADIPGGSRGLIRLSANAASFSYELSFAVETLASLLR